MPIATPEKYAEMLDAAKAGPGRTARASARACHRPAPVTSTQISPTASAEPTSQGPKAPTWAAKKYQTAAPMPTETAVEINRWISIERRRFTAAWAASGA